MTKPDDGLSDEDRETIRSIKTCDACGKPGIYLGCQPAGGPYLTIGYRCTCLTYWSAIIPRDSLDFFR